MKSAFVPLLAFASLATAQQMNIATINAAPLPPTTAAPVGQSGQSTVAYNTAAAATSISSDVQPTQAASSPNKEKRDGSCASQGSGSFPQVQPDTDTKFQSYPYFHAVANAAVPPYPYVEKFRDLNGSTQQNSYLTYYVLPTYNVTKCASNCDSVNLCTSFNIYAERDPSVDPGPNCPNPSSITVYKCVLWGSSISKQTATNTGQYRQNFHVVIAASNGYEKTNTTLPEVVAGYTPTLNLSSQAITQAGSYFMGSEFFTGPYDPALCGFFASAQTAANKQDAQNRGVHTYQPANMFNAYTVYKSSVAWGTYCALFNQNFDASYAGPASASSGGYYYSIGSSWTYAANPQDPGTC